MQMHHQRPQSRLQVRHHQCRRNALAFNVGNHQQERLRTEMKEVVIVSAALEARLVRHR